MNYGGSNAAQNLFMRSYKAYSPAFFGKAEINKGNKSKHPAFSNHCVVILPSSALHEMARLNISYPMMFMVSNPQVGKKTYCGVLEFSAEEGMCYLPIWMMNNLFLEEGTDVMLRNVQLPKGKFVVLQPHETAFINLANPKAILENQLTNYSCLMKGDTINIHHSGKDYLIDIVDCKPADQICVVEADIEVDFREPHDFKEVQAKQFSSAQSAKTSQQQKLHIDEEHVLK
jgi:ubiquitin fusion degradation protein 1